MTIVPPEKFAYSSYVVNRDLCDFSAIDFFEFEKFPSRRQHFASIAWKEIIMLVKKQNPKGAKMLIHEWNTTKDVRRSYWKDKEENEKKIVHLTALEEHARKQTLDAARKVDHDTEILVDDIIREKATGKVQRPSQPTSALTPILRAVGEMRKQWQQNDVESSSSRRLHPKSTHSNEFEGVQERIDAQQENSLGSPKHSALRDSSEEDTPTSLHNTSKASDRKRVEDDEEYGILHDDVNDGDDTDANGQGDDYEDIKDDEVNDLQMVEATSPFDDLVAELFRKYNHQAPVVAPISPPLHGTLKGLHSYASSKLAKWEELPEVEKKSTIVALSGILNTMDNEMEDFEDMETVRTACYDESFSVPSKEMQSLLNEFVEAMGPSRDLWQLKIFCRREQLQAMENRRENSERAKYVNVVEYLCTLIELKKWSDSLSETEFVAKWEHIFSLLLPTTIATRTGELGLKETRLDRKKSEWCFALNDHNIKSRKVDLLFQSKFKYRQSKECRQNIAVFEAKGSDPSQPTLWIQIRKNLRLNKSLVCALRYAGIDETPLILDLQGPRAFIYTIKKFGDFYGAGNVTDQIIRLPTTDYEMYMFLTSGSFSALCKVKERLEKTDVAVREAVWRNEEQEHQHVMRTTTALSRVYDDIPTIWTPTKKRKIVDSQDMKLGFKKNPHMTVVE